MVEKQQHVNYHAIWMGDLEINLVLRYMDNVSTYLEWGSGGSTFNFPQFAKRAYSIEHDQSWCAPMMNNISSHPELKHLRYDCVPIPRGTKGWGLEDPFEEGTYEVFKPYVDHISKLGEEMFDVVLIDGRARVDASIKALSYIGKDSVVILHDAERIRRNGAYWGVSAYYDIIDFVGGLRRQGIAVLQRKPAYSHLQGDHTAVQNMLYRKYPMMRETGNRSST
ncbi:hypothetical protein FGB62_25g229 [Gracilaria domingensis]|nr:hypothetical protein FGB62_25g229 [Gracilaria domingensis]